MITSAAVGILIADTPQGPQPQPQPQPAPPEVVVQPLVSTGAPWWLVVAALLVGTAAGAGLLYLAVRNRRGRGEIAPAASEVALATPVAGLDPVGGASNGAADAARSRSGLVDGLVSVYDRLPPDDPLRANVAHALAGAGVALDDPTGLRFDPNLHTAVGTVATGDPQMVGVIAMVSRPGVRDGDEVVRRAEVRTYALG